MPNRDHGGQRQNPLRTQPNSVVESVSEKFAAALAARVHYRDEILDLVRSHRYVVFFGCGNVFKGVAETWIQAIGKRLDFCCDSNPANWGQTFCGARCLSPQELLELKNDCVVFVTIGNFRPVVDQLMAAGFQAVHLIYKYDLVNSDFLDRQDLAAVARNLSRARLLLGDDKSLRVFDAIVQRVVGGGRDPQLMAAICEGDQYFPSDIVTLTDREQFVDIGAFDGDTVTDFVRRTEGRFDHVYAFELDRINYGHLQENVARLPNADRIRAFNLGIWDSEQDVTYSVGQSQSTVGSGEAVGHVVPLDAALRGDSVSFIKIDIEGAEPQALQGARGIIATQKPTLAVCVYHHFSHLWQIPLFIHDLLPDHRIFLRHHTRLEYETVCYAVPPKT
jgi:FkbM family methyltransferase